MNKDENNLSSEEQIEYLSQLADGYMEKYVYFKDMVFDIIEGKLTIEQVKMQMYGFERGYDK